MTLKMPRGSSSSSSTPPMISAMTYRLRRFGALADRDLASTGALAEVWLAIQAAGALGLTD
ncbi:hypothetical protein [Streptomyces sp. NPDC051286]|uniref:hypothetical protein n=1 Tax=Streptomyces sp. NPDC051286 TaxID=3365647 RepID=UPI00379282E3